MASFQRTYNSEHKASTGVGSKCSVRTRFSRCPSGPGCLQDRVLGLDQLRGIRGLRTLERAHPRSDGGSLGPPLNVEGATSTSGFRAMRLTFQRRRTNGSSSGVVPVIVSTVATSCG